MNITLRVDGTKFYKLHSFAASDFFNDPALVRPLVSEDRPAQSVSIAAETVEEALITPEVVRQAPECPKRQPRSCHGQVGDARPQRYCGSGFARLRCCSIPLVV